MAIGSQFRVGDRVGLTHPINLVGGNLSGTILRVFLVSDIYDVLFDGQTEPRIVACENLVLETPLLVREAAVQLQ